MSEMLQDRPLEAISNPEAAEVNLQEAFHVAERSIADIVVQDKFVQLCEKWRINPTDPSKAEFWRVVAKCGADQARETRESGEGSLQNDVNEVVAAAPNYVYIQGNLNMNKAHGHVERQALKQRASHFNSLLRDFAEAHPDTNVREFYGGVAHMARLCVSDERYRDQGVDGIWTSIRGARHEAAFGKILEVMGERVRPSTIDEDLEGVDYVVSNHNGSELRIDVKTSRYDIAASGKDTDFSIDNFRHKQSIKVLSPLSNAELGETMLPDDQLLQEKTAVLGKLMHRIREVA
jgi:hypothetical protein